ncbi:MFS transporter [Sphaerisporangium rufum]|uniref:MFS transporter n=1 Tax=Sphaerisporangium rufum TaxID=1381558 RepID=A0A919R2Y4_9ACTN|nr:MFS transporter [Sphaerisporangium rufum]GII78741.1 MFS transporter [Sphaerisporangium rufum]
MSVTSPTGVLRRDRDFRRFWLGHSVSAMGAQVTAVALPLVASLTLGAGPAGVAAVATAAFLPNVLLPLLAGHWLERRRRRRVMIAMDLFRAAALLVVPLAHLAGLLSIPLLVAVAFAVGAAGVVFDIGGFAYVPSLVAERDLPAANQAMQGSTTAAQVAGPGVAGMIAQLAGPAPAVAIDAASYVASAAGVAGARRPEPPPAAAGAPSGILDGLRPIARNPFLRALTAHAAVYNCAAQILTVNLIVFAVTERGLGAGLYGLALSASGAGALLGTLVALRLAGRVGYGRAFAAALVLSTGTPLLLAALPWRGGALAAALAAVQLVAGVGLGAANVLSVTLRQVIAPRGALARTNGGYRLLIYGVLPIGSALGGVIGQAAGCRAGVAAGAAGMALSALPMFARRVRSLREPGDAAPGRLDGRAEHSAATGAR